MGPICGEPVDDALLQYWRRYWGALIEWAGLCDVYFKKGIWLYEAQQNIIYVCTLYAHKNLKYFIINQEKFV